MTTNVMLNLNQCKLEAAFLFVYRRSWGSEDLFPLYFYHQAELLTLCLFSCVPRRALLFWDPKWSWAFLEARDLVWGMCPFAVGKVSSNKCAAI